MSHAQYTLWTPPEKQKFNFPGLIEKGASEPMPTVQNPQAQGSYEEEAPQKGRSSKKNAVEGAEKKPKKEVKKKPLPFGNGKVL
jgi:hypothetical protein